MSKAKVTKGSGNVFAGLGLEDAPLLQAKADLAIAITRRVRELALSQTAAGARMGLDQPKVSNIMRGRLDGFSMDRLVECLNALAYEVVITVGPSRKEIGRLKVRQVLPRKRKFHTPRRKAGQAPPRKRELALA